MKPRPGMVAMRGTIFIYFSPTNPPLVLLLLELKQRQPRRLMKSNPLPKVKPLRRLEQVPLCLRPSRHRLRVARRYPHLLARLQMAFT